MPHLERPLSAPAGVEHPDTLDKDGEKESLDPDTQNETSVMLNVKSKPVDLSQVPVLLNKPGRVDPSQTSPNSNQEDGEEEEEEEEGGAHDTITSLAGVKMLQKYRRQIRGHGFSRRGSQGSTARLEELFKEEPLLEEEEKAGLTDEEQEEEDEPEDVFIPPDGGYGWLVALGAFICLFWTAGLVKSYGVIFAEMMKLYPEDIRIASWIPAAMTTTALAMAPIASALCQRLNCRLVTGAGSIIAAIGLTLSAFMPNLLCMFFTLGILTGAGIGLSTTPGIILTARYFDKKRARANAFCLSGTAAGSFSLPILIQTLLSVYGFSGTLLLLGACMLHALISAALFRPLAVHVQILRNKANKAAREALDTEAAEALQTAPTREEDIENGAVPEPIKKVDEGSENEYPAPSYSSSCPQPSFMGDMRSRHNSEEFPAPLVPLSRFRYIDNSFDTISMMSSVSNRSSEPDRYNEIEPGLQKDISGSRLDKKNMFYRQESDLSAATAKSLSLRELAIHQIGSHLNLYKAMLLGSSPRSGDINSSDESKLHRKSSFMFSCEDIMVDSTSILKDSRHPSHTHLAHGKQDGTTHRVVTLNRTQSAVGQVTRKPSCRRQRNFSESDYDPVFNKNLSFCNLSSNDKKITLIGSTELVSEESQKKKFAVHPASSSDNGKVVKKRESIIDKISRYIDLSLCLNPVFLLLAGSVMMMAVGMPHCLYFLPTYAMNAGLSSSDASLLLSLSAVFDLGGRLVFGFLLDLNLFPKYLAYASMMFLSGFAAISLPSATTFVEISVCMGCYGVGTGSWFLMVPLLLAEQLGVEKIASSYGLVRFFQSLTNFSGPMISGYLYSSTGSLQASFYFMGSSILIGGVVILFLPLALRCAKKKNQPEQ